MRTTIHIGMNKTGTSSLQFWLSKNRDSLREQGVSYPNIGLEMHAHHELSRSMKSARGNPAELEDLRRQIAVARNGANHAVFSSENFHTIENVDVVAEIFKPEDTDIVVYVREPISYVVSWYQQAIQSRPVAMTLRQFAELHYRSQDEIVQRWCDVFGAERVMARVFHRESLAGRDIRTDFVACALPGVDISAFEKGDDKNISISGNLLFLKRLLNVFLTDSDARALAHEIGALAMRDEHWNGKLAVDEQTIRHLHRLTRGDRRALISRGLKLPSVPQSIEGHVSPDYETLKGDLKKICRHLERKGMSSPTWQQLRRILPMMNISRPAQR